MQISELTASHHPTPEQLAWQRSGVSAFFHFGVNTFADLEWSDGTVPAEAFNPASLDTDQWVATAASFGVEHVILTAKHHDGFCLWPTATTDYSVAASAWREGRGDVVAELRASCDKHGIGLGLYLSPWDRNRSFYDDVERYDAFYCAQLEELTTRYGDLVEIWFDGAGSEGREYDWDSIMAICGRNQPQAMIFNMGDYTIRWVGNEDGFAADPVKYVVDTTPISMFTDSQRAAATLKYAPPECDVSIRPGWFWHEHEQPHSLEHLLDIHDRSVGLGAHLLLNLPPNRGGLVDEIDVQRCAEFGAALQRRESKMIDLQLKQIAEGSWEATLPDVCVALELTERIEQGQRVASHRIFLDDELLLEAGTIGIRRRHGLCGAGLGTLRIELEGPAPVLESARAQLK